MKITLFTVEQANQTMLKIRGDVEAMIDHRRVMVEIERRLEVMPLALAGATGANPDTTELQQLERQRVEAATKIRGLVGAVHELGCVIKDIDRGLVDFYSMAGDRLVFLCWQAGEAEVSHWHTLEGGFGSRQPIHTSELGDES